MRHSRLQTVEISHVLASFVHLIPIEFCRKTRTLDDISRFKVEN